MNRWGGLNSLVLGLSHPGHFDKVAALCPAVYRDSPFAPLGQIREAVVRTGAEPRIVFGIWQLSRRYLSSAEEWRRFSPLVLIEALAVQHARPSLYLSAGLYDRYGLYEGTERLAQRAAQRGVPTEWHPLYGGTLRHRHRIARGIPGALSAPQRVVDRGSAGSQPG